MHARALERAADLARSFLDALPGRPVGAIAAAEDLRAAFGGRLPDAGEDPATVVEDLARAADGGLVASAGPRYFGFVIGGSLPAALGAEWLAAAWDQNAGLRAASPAAAVVEEIAAGWLLDLLGLPEGASVGFVTGCQMANFTCLASARHEVLRRAGWDVEERGLQDAPKVHVLIGEEAHVTIGVALRMLGLGAGAAARVPADAQGRMRPEALEVALRECDGPTIVCAQAGNVSTGAFDPLESIAALARARGAWLHVDGAFGLWAAASDRLRGLLAGASLADSWATDAHKWLNVPYDSGLAIVAHPEAHRAAMSVEAPYLARPGGTLREPMSYVPESSRRARGFAVYAALRSLGRRGVASLVERCCALALRMAESLTRDPVVELLNEVVLNQVLVRFEPPRGGDPDAFTRDVIARVQREGTCWAGGTRRAGREALRISVSNWSTTERDVDLSVEAILAAARAAGREGAP